MYLVSEFQANNDSLELYYEDKEKYKNDIKGSWTRYKNCDACSYRDTDYKHDSYERYLIMLKFDHEQPSLCSDCM